MARLSTAAANGDIFLAGTTGATSGLNAVADRVNIHNHYFNGNNSPGYITLLAQSTGQNPSATATIPAGSLFNGDVIRAEIFAIGSWGAGSLNATFLASGAIIGIGSWVSVMQNPDSGAGIFSRDMFGEVTVHGGSNFWSRLNNNSSNACTSVPVSWSGAVAGNAVAITAAVTNTHASSVWGSCKISQIHSSGVL